MSKPTIQQAFSKLFVRLNQLEFYHGVIFVDEIPFITHPINEIETEIFNYPANKAIKTVDIFLDQIKKLKEQERSIISAITVEIYDDDLNDTKPANDFQKEKALDELFESISLELNFYEDKLLILKDSLLLNLIIENNNTTSNEVLSFEYINLSTNPEALTDVYNALKKNNFIDEDTSLINFKKVFSGKEVSTPITWIGNIGELSYFIKYACNTKKKMKPTNRRHWEIAVHCFIRPDTKRFETSQLHDAKKPSTFSKIEVIVNNFE